MTEEEQTAELKSADTDEKVESSPTSEAEASPASEVEGGASETTEEPKKVNSVQKRINQLTREKHEQRQENAELKARLDKLEKAPPAAQEPALVAPKEDDFETDSEFQAANAKFIADTASNAAYDRLSAENQTRDEEAQQTQRQKELTDKKAVFETNLDEKRGNFADFEDVAYGHPFMDLDLVEQIFDIGDKGPEIAYHLGSNLEEAERIFNLAPVQRARELTKLEFQVEALKPKKVSDAPDPITPLGNSETVDNAGVNGENIKDPDEWRQWDFERQRKKREA